MAGINSAVTNIVIVLVMVQVSKRISFEDPDVLKIARVVYAVSNVIILMLYLAVRIKINAKKDLTTLKFVPPTPMGSVEAPKLVTTTVAAYDLSQLQQLHRGQGMGVIMMGVMHLYFGYTNPLVIQSIIPLKAALESPLVRIHVLGAPASGELKRPFKQAGGLFGAFGQGEAQCDKKAIQASEKAGRGGAKEE